MPHPAPVLAIELSGTGTHPASWRRADSRAEELFTPAYWVDAVTAADRAGFEFAFLPDSFALQADGARGRLEAVAVAARTAAVTERIGLIPQVPVTHTEPFHASKAIASLDYATHGRAGWEVVVSPGAKQAKLFGRKAEQDDRSLWREAGDGIEVVTRLWDSWEDDAEIRDTGTGRFIDRDKLHYIDFEGEYFSVKGPSITPRPPQGQPLIAVRADDPYATDVAVRRADLIRIAAPDLRAAAERRNTIRAAASAAGRDPDTLRVLLDVEVHLAETAAAANAEVRQLDEWSAPDTPASIRHIGTIDTIREVVQQVRRERAADGAVLRPLALAAFTARLPRPLLTARGRLGLDRPANRYASARG